MALIERNDGLTIVELLLATLIAAGIAAAVASSVRALSLLERREKARLERLSARAIVKETFAAAILGASRFMPEPLYRIDRGTLTVAEILPDVIYQRQRSTGAPRGTFCRTSTGIPKPGGRDELAALAISSDARWFVRISLSASRLRCREGRAFTLRYTDLSTPFGLARGEAEAEAIFPVREIYSLFLDGEGSLRRRSHLTGEHQEIWPGFASLEIARAAAPPSISVSFERNSSPRPQETIVLSAESGGRADWLDLIW